MAILDQDSQISRLGIGNLAPAVNKKSYLERWSTGDCHDSEGPYKKLGEFRLSLAILSTFAVRFLCHSYPLCVFSVCLALRFVFALFSGTCQWYSESLRLVCKISRWRPLNSIFSASRNFRPRPVILTGIVYKNGVFFVQSCSFLFRNLMPFHRLSSRWNWRDESFSTFHWLLSKVRTRTTLIHRWSFRQILAKTFL